MFLAVVGTLVGFAVLVCAYLVFTGRPISMPTTLIPTSLAPQHAVTKQPNIILSCA